MKSCLGGTFDHLHNGHKSLLQAAFSGSDFVLVGLTSDKFANANHKYKSNLESFRDRKAELKNFLYANNFLERAKIDEIQDEVGTSLKYEDLGAIYCTPDTRDSAEKINKRRAMRALSALKVFEVPMVMAEDTLPISSERVRRGIINTEGKVLQWTGKTAGYSLK